MDLQEKLIQLSEYGVTFNVANSNFVIKVKYNDNWTIIQPDGNEIAFYRDENDSSVYYYVAPITTSMEKLFLAIDETIEYNKELELKVVLFKEKMKELQEIFSTEPLDILNTLEFKMRKKKVIPKKIDKVERKEEEQPVQPQEPEEPVTEPKKRKKQEKKSEGEIKAEEKMSEIDEKINKLLNT